MYTKRFTAEERLQREMKSFKWKKRFKWNKDQSRQFDLMGNSIKKMTGKIVGPTGTPYEGGTFHLSFEISDNYPFSPPKVRFITPIWHPNVSRDNVTGEVCMDILKNGWTASMTLETVMLALQALMSAPETDNAGFVASQYKWNREKFNKIAQHCAHKYAGENLSILNVASFDDLVHEVLTME